MSENTNMETQQQTTTPTPEETGGRMFTQEEVNRIVSDRLARERAKAEPSPLDERDAAIKARESALDCKEYLGTKQYPPELADILDTSDAERFKATVDKLAQLPGGLCSSRNLVHVDLFPSCSFNSGGKTDILADAFKPPKI